MYLRQWIGALVLESLAFAALLGVLTLRPPRAETGAELPAPEDRSQYVAERLEPAGQALRRMTAAQLDALANSLHTSP